MGRDQSAPHQTFLIEFHEYIEYRAGQWLGDGMLVSPLAGLIDPGAVGGERDAGHVVHGGKIVGQSYLLGIGNLADAVHQVQHVKIAAGLLQQPGLRPSRNAARRSVPPDRRTIREMPETAR